MSQLDPTGVESVTDERPADNIGGFSADDEVASLENGDLGIGEPTTMPGIARAGMVAFEAPPEAPQAPSLPIPRAPQAAAVTRKAVSGSYGGVLGAFQVELRVDIDRTRPMRRLSGDFYQTTGRTVAHVGSFVVDAPTITASATQYVVKGKGRFTFAATARLIQVTIPRVQPSQPQAAATLQFLSAAGVSGAIYHCAYESPYFRTVRIETDSVSDVAPPLFASYDTGSLPSGGAGRPISVVGAFAEAGIAMSPTAGSKVIDVREAGIDATWSDAEMHASMQQHFSLWSDLPQWCVWQLVAHQHDEGPLLYGIMFDQGGKERRGCATFHAEIEGTLAAHQRDQLYTYVRELAH